MNKENPLFNNTTVQRLSSDVNLTSKQRKAVSKWLNYLQNDKLVKEKEAYIEFANVILKDLLNYDISLDGLKHEEANIEFLFKKNGNNLICFEVKGTKTKDLWAYQGRDKKSRETPVNQINSYMYEQKIPFGILTNYHTFVLFDRNEGNKKYHLIDFTELTNEDKLKEFVALFSREQVEKGFILNLIQQSIIEEREFTKEFYKLYHETRLMLIKEFEENSEISKEASVHFAQLYLNRLMFVFFAEDTGKIHKRIIEDRILKTLDNIHLFSSNSSNISNVLVGLFKDLDKGSDFPVKLFGFNGGLFKHPIPPKIYFKDFRNNKFFKDVNQYSKLKKKDLELNEQEKEIFEKYKNKINPIVRNILLMASFDFNTEVNVNILGHIFEQSISDIENLKTDSSSRRKKEGIFYTPEYITDYICRNTIITYLSRKGVNSVPKLIREYAENISELEEKFRNIKILDPACGSGAFLIKATDIMLEIFRAIQELKQQEGEYTSKIKGKTKKKEVGQNITLIKWNEEAEARQIIENNIYGVDINEESIEITKLSLFLKMARKNRKLTNLSNNIKQGNSLIDDKEVAGELAFNWDKEFPFKFDIVIGNPPYGAKLSEKEVKFVKTNYTVGNSETAQLMMEKAYFLLKDVGYHGFIIPKAFTFVSTWDKIRSKFLDELNILIDCKKVWKEVKLEQIIYTIQKGNKFPKYNSGIRDNQSIKIIAKVDKSLIPKFDGVLLNSLTNQEIKIGSKIKAINSRLKDLGKDSRGDLFYQQMNQDKKGFKVLGGNEIQKYYKRGIKGYIEDKYAEASNALIKPNSILLQRIIAHIEKPTNHLKITGTIFEDSNYKIVDTVYQITLDEEISNKYALALINSNFMNWFVYRFVFAKAIRSFQFSGDVAKKIPIPKISPREQKPFIEKADSMLNLNKEFYEKKNKFFNRIKKSFKLEKINKKLNLFFELKFNDFINEIEKQSKKKLSLKEQDEWEDYFNDYKKDLINLKDKIEKTDNEINQMVYKLYDLSKEDIVVIEESLR